MKKTLMVWIMFLDEETGVVTEQIVETYTGQYGYEVENLFYKLGEKVAKTIDPQHGAEYPPPEEL